MPQKFKIGDYVQLKIGGAQMLVQDYEKHDAKLVICLWRESGRDQSGCYHEDMLTKDAPRNFSIISIY